MKKGVTRREIITVYYCIISNPLWDNQPLCSSTIYDAHKENRIKKTGFYRILALSAFGTMKQEKVRVHAVGVMFIYKFPFFGAVSCAFGRLPS
jgi:hypothetical protein